MRHGRRNAELMWSAKNAISTVIVRCGCTFRIYKIRVIQLAMVGETLNSRGAARRMQIDVQVYGAISNYRGEPQTS